MKSLRSWIQYLLIYMIIIFNGSIIYVKNSDFFIILSLLLGINLMLIYKIKFKKSDLSVYLIISILLIVEVIITCRSLSLPSVLNTLSRFMIVYVAININKEKFVDRFLNITILLSMISLVCFLISYTPLEVILRKNLIVNHISEYNFYTTYGGLLFNYIPEYGRNVGVFREPGIYQMILNVALILLLFKKNSFNHKKKIHYFIILIITILTAQSTTGYIGLIGIILLFIQRQSNYKLKKDIIISLCIISSLILIVFGTGNDSFIYENFIKKLEYNKEDNRFENGSGNARLIMMRIDLEIAKENPMGLGNKNYDKLFMQKKPISMNDVSSCVGITKTIAVYGIFIGSFLIYLVIKSFIKNSNSVLEFVCKLFIFINTCLAQPQIFFPAILILMLYEDEVILE